MSENNGNAPINKTPLGLELPSLYVNVFALTSTPADDMMRICWGEEINGFATYRSAVSMRIGNAEQLRDLLTQAIDQHRQMQAANQEGAAHGTRQ